MQDEKHMAGVADLRLLRAVAVTDSLERGPNLANQPGSRGMPAKRGKLHRLR